MTKTNFMASSMNAIELIEDAKNTNELLEITDSVYSNFTTMFILNQDLLTDKDIKLKFRLNEYSASYRRGAIKEDTPINDAKGYAKASVYTLRHIVDSIF